MLICPQCKTEYPDDQHRCDECDVELETERDMQLKTVYRAPNEFMALTVESLLSTEGIKAIVRSLQIPMYNGIAQLLKPAWGEVMVLEKDYHKALRIVNDFVDEEDRR